MENGLRHERSRKRQHTEMNVNGKLPKGKGENNIKSDHVVSSHEAEIPRVTKRGRRPIQRTKLCHNCATTETTSWRMNPKKELLCNACALYLKLYGDARPQHMWGRKPVKRNRHKLNTKENIIKSDELDYDTLKDSPVEQPKLSEMPKICKSTIIVTQPPLSSPSQLVQESEVLSQGSVEELVKAVVTPQKKSAPRRTVIHVFRSLGSSPKCVRSTSEFWESSFDRLDSIRNENYAFNLKRKPNVTFKKYGVEMESDSNKIPYAPIHAFSYSHRSKESRILQPLMDSNRLMTDHVHSHSLVGKSNLDLLIECALGGHVDAT
jgi:hypothetical protein